MQAVNIGLLGLGTVGCGTVDLLTRSAQEIERRAGRRVIVKRASVRDLNKPRTCTIDGAALTEDPYAVIRDPEISVVVELMGGLEPTRTLVLEAIAEGKHVVTANKALIAEHGNEIFQAARDRGVIVAFEAAVGGGIPVIKAIRESLAGNHIQWLAGIINGTTNFILTEMRDRGMDFSDALAEAQALGYAEADPTFDVEGVDAAHKLTILAAIAFGIPLQFDRVYTEGIGAIGYEDIEYAAELGYAIKHLGIAQRTESGVELRVHPTLIPRKGLLASVDGVMNAVLIHGDAAGDMLFYGAGAGAMPTASAVVADLVDVVRVLSADPEHRVPYLGFQDHAISHTEIVPMESVEAAYYLRLQVEDHPGVMADITRILAEHAISIEAILQKPSQSPGQAELPVILLTHVVREGRLDEALKQIAQLVSVSKQITRIRLHAFQ
ncbi:MAG: homoserine dehydrogenase [Pseudomonadota bacterium]|nr:homoserine dehydrogenase [Pseudomonadota bacterium]